MLILDDEQIEELELTGQTGELHLIARLDVLGIDRNEIAPERSRT